jgi:hypothetical protein
MMTVLDLIKELLELVEKEQGADEIIVWCAECEERTKIAGVDRQNDREQTILTY